MTTFTRPERVPLPFNVRLSHELVSDLDELAARHQTTRSRIIRGLLQQGLEQIKGSDDASQAAE
jgi:metal-responsive CopG/Arc/MetJ family transcriptional regulator